MSCMPAIDAKRCAVSPSERRHETLEELHGVLVAGMVLRLALKPGDAAVWADAIVAALQESYGGTRMGPGGVYIPAPNLRAERDARIRELMGERPHTRKRAKETAHEVGCGIATVWRAIGVR